MKKLLFGLFVLIYSCKGQPYPVEVKPYVPDSTQQKELMALHKMIIFETYRLNTVMRYDKLDTSQQRIITEYWDSIAHYEGVFYNLTIHEKAPN